MKKENWMGLVRTDEIKVIEYSVTFAVRYWDASNSLKMGAEKNLVLNSVSHGYYMGYRFKESELVKKGILWSLKNKFFKSSQDPDVKLILEANKASSFYLKEKYKNLTHEERSLIFSCCAKGFMNGFKDCERTVRSNQTE